MSVEYFTERREIGVMNIGETGFIIIDGKEYRMKNKKNYNSKKAAAILNNFKLDRKIALITGCRRGIGKAIAVAIAQADADIIGVSATLEEKDSEIENEVKKRGKEFKGYKADF